MKTLADGTQVSSRTYYFLLDFNDRDNWKVITTLCGKPTKLSELDIQKYSELFKIASELDLTTLKSKIKKENTLSSVCGCERIGAWCESCEFKKDCELFNSKKT